VHFLVRIDLAVFQIFCDFSRLSGRPLDWKAKMPNDDILSAVGAQSGAKSGEGLMIC
jgi:hypothetical protein